MREGVSHVGLDYDGNPQRTNDGIVEHCHYGYRYWHPVDRKHPDSISEVSTLLMIDEAISKVTVAKDVLDSVGSMSEHVYQAEFEQFTRDIGEVIDRLLVIGMEISKEMEEERKRKEAEKNGLL